MLWAILKLPSGLLSPGLGNSLPTEAREGAGHGTWCRVRGRWSGLLGWAAAPRSASLSSWLWEPCFLAVDFSRASPALRHSGLSALLPLLPSSAGRGQLVSQMRSLRCHRGFVPGLRTAWRLCPLPTPAGDLCPGPQRVPLTGDFSGRAACRLRASTPQLAEVLRASDP